MTDQQQQQPNQDHHQPEQSQEMKLKEDKAGNIALVCGICSFSGLLIPIAGWILGLLGLSYGLRGRKGENAKKAIAGLVCGLVGFVVSVINFSLGVSMINQML